MKRILIARMYVGELEKLGFVVVEEKGELTELELPDGWKCCNSSDGKIFEIKDSNDVVRIEVFSHAMNILTRYCITCCPKRKNGSCPNYHGFENSECLVIWDRKKNKILVQIDVFDVGYDSENDAYSTANFWLEKRYPEYDNPLAYWDK